MAGVPLVTWTYAAVGTAWSVIAVLLIGRIMVANLMVLRGRGRAVSADSGAAAACEALSRVVGVRMPAIGVSSQIHSPCLVGIFRPTVLLPAAMESVSRDILVHEMAHLRRHDCSWQLLSRLTTALLWFQPLTWLLSRRLEQAADDVADDFVVHFGSDRAEYARQLVDIAERYQPEWSAACVGAGIVSFKSSLAKRVVRILDSSRSPSTRTGRVALAAIILMGATCTLGAGLLGIGQAHAEQDDSNVAAKANGDDPAQENASKDAKAKPIRGQILNTEGRPVAGVMVRITGLLRSSTGSLDGFLEAWKNDANVAMGAADRLPAHADLSAKTDEDGKFEIQGVGGDRVAFLEMKHPRLASTKLWVVNRPGFDAKLHNDAALRRWPAESRRPGLLPQLIGPQFRHVVDSGRTIEGVVYLGKDRTPLSRAMVTTVVGYNIAASALTDENGAFSIHGVGRRPEHSISVIPPAGRDTLLQRSIVATFPEGERKLNIDVELTEGVVLTGRVVDPKTGQGVWSRIRATPLPGNKYLDQPAYASYLRESPSINTKPDGTFRLVTIPGPSVVTAQVLHREKMGQSEINPFREAKFSAEDAKQVEVKMQAGASYFVKADGSIEYLMLKSAVKYLDLKPDGEAVGVELKLDRGGTRQVEIQDDQGKQITGAFAVGVTEHRFSTIRLGESRCTVYGLGEDRPRKLLLLHPRRQLAASLTVKGNEAAPVVVKLAPTGSVVGRALDEGAPIGNAKVIVRYYKNQPADELRGYSAMATATTDAKGRFRVDGLMPGEPFVLDFQEGDRLYRGYANHGERAVESGQVRDFKDLTINKLR